MRVLLTGASGYLGQAVIASGVFQNLTTLSRHNCHINCDLAKQIPELPSFDMVIHAAGKAHSVPRTNAEQSAFFEVNVTGTRNLLLGLAQAGVPNTLVFISTVAVYGLFVGEGISEAAALNAQDAYGKSKAEAESLVTEWCRQHKVHCVILRLPLIVGPNPPGNLGSMIRAIRGGYYMNIGGGTMKRSGVLLQDVVQLLPALYGKDGICNLTDGADFTYAQIGKLIASQLGCKPPRNLPFGLALVLARFGNLLGSKAPFNEYKLNKLMATLTFDTQKAKELFDWKPQNVLAAFSIK